MAEVTETRRGTPTSQPSQKVLGVVAVFQEDRETAPSLLVAVRSPCRIGRDPVCRIALQDSQASREHAEVCVSGGELLITDLNSRNGTYVNGQPVVSPKTSAPVGSTLRCGKTLLRVVADVHAFESHPLGGKDSLIGGPGLAEIRRWIEAAALVPAPVLLQGETGTGKEKVAEAIHVASQRTGAYVPVNCAAFPAELVESELFGHTRGAFSGSDRARTGLFRAAHQGTLLLDEIGDLAQDVQAKLLRFLESGEVRAVGSDQTMIVDVRLLAASNLDLEALVAAGRFRADLLHRITGFRISVPPLRARLEDVPALAQHFLPNLRIPFSVEAMEQLLGYSWPGNVRELRNTVLSSCARAAAEGSRHIEPQHLPSFVPPAPAPHSAASTEAQVLRGKIETALRLREGNVAQVARDLGVTRPWLYQELHRHGLDPASFRKR